MKVQRPFCQRMFLFAIASLVSLLFYSCLPDQPRNLPKFKEKLMQNKVAFEKAAEAFHKQMNPRYLGYAGDSSFNIGSDYISFKNQIFSDSTVNIDKIEIKENRKFEDFDQFLSEKGITRREFFKCADFLKKYDIMELIISSCTIRVVLEGGFLGSRSGIVYFPVGCEHEIDTYFPNPPEGVYPLYKLDERWFYFYE